MVGDGDKYQGAHQGLTGGQDEQKDTGKGDTAQDVRRIKPAERDSRSLDAADGCSLVAITRISVKRYARARAENAPQALVGMSTKICVLVLACQVWGRETGLPGCGVWEFARNASPTNALTFHYFTVHGYQTPGRLLC